MNEYKKLKIKQSLKETRERRQFLQIATYELKIIKSKTSKEVNNQLHKMFLEAKWVHNHILSLENLKSFDSKTTVVNVMNKEKEIEQRELTTISSQMKQGLNARMLNSTKSLSVLKKHNRKIGKLKYKSEINSIPLKQYGHTYKIDKIHRKIKIEGIKQHLPVKGIDQLKNVVEYANANLIKKGNDFFLKVTVYGRKQELNLEGSVGIDFGISDSIVLSTGEKFNVKVPVSQRTKKMQREVSKKVKRSKNHWKARFKLQKAYDHTNNQKKDLKNKILNKIVKNYKIVCFQNENIQGWQKGLFGKQISQSALGGIISDLKIKSHTPMMIPRSFPSTQLCPKCKQKTYHPLEKRSYVCETKGCGYTHPCRDTHSANNVLEKGLDMLLNYSDCLVPRESRDFKPAEIVSSAGISNDTCVRKQPSVTQEAHELIRW